MKKKITILSLLMASAFGYAQEDLQELIENIDINLYLRSSLEVPEKEQGGLKVNEARFEIRGKAADQLEYRLRYRANRNSPAGTLNDATSALDHAYIHYKFGENHKWNAIVGKQINYYGNWEFYDNPTFEYRYSYNVRKLQNLFPVAIKLSYNVDEHHSLHLQAYNTIGNTLSKLAENEKYTINDLKPSRLPIGVNLAWKGQFFDKKWRTFYSLSTSQVAEGKRDYKISLGNKLVLNKLSGYLDLQHSHSGIDHFKAISSELNAYQLASDPTFIKGFAKDIESQLAVLKLNYSLTPNWHITAKTAFERINSKDKSLNLGNNINQRTLNLVGLEFKPFEKQDFKLFAYYANETNTYNSALKIPTSNVNTFAIGALWFLRAL